MENGGHGFGKFQDGFLRELLNMKINQISADKMVPKHKNQPYRTAFYRYGLLPVLLLLEMLEEREIFYECYLIKLTIDEINSELEYNMPTRFGDDAVREVRQSYEKMGWNYQNYMNNLPSYISELNDYISNNRPLNY